MITLINPPSIKTLTGLQMQSPNPPLGLAYIAAAVRDAGIPYHVIDATGEALDFITAYPTRDNFRIQGMKLDDIIRRIPPETRVIGLHCNFSHLWPLTRMVAERARDAFPDALIVLGGEHGTAVYEHVLGNSPIDVVVSGEGEETIVNLVRTHEAGDDLASVTGIAFLDAAGAVKTTGLSARIRTVDELPWPDWDSFPIREYIDRHQINGMNLGRSMPLLATRGCPYECTFCSNPFMWTRRYITRDPKLLVDEMAHYADKYAVVNFDFQDLTAIVNYRWAVALCEEMIARGLNVTWQLPSGTRAEVFDDRLLNLMYEAGCRALSFAPESGSPEMLKTVKKQVDLGALIGAMKMAIRAKLKLSCFIVIGFPNEQTDTLRATMKLIRRMALIGVHDVSVTKFVPYPGSELFRELQETGKIEMDDAFFVTPMDFYTTDAPSYANAISTRRLYRTMMWMFVNFYVISFATHPIRTFKVLFTAVTQGVEESRYAKWFVDRFFTRRKWRQMTQDG